MEKSRDILLPFAIAWWILAIDKTLEHYNIRVIDTLLNQWIPREISVLVQENSFAIGVLVALWFYIWWKYKWAANEKKKRKKIETKEHGDMLSASFSFITPRGNFIIDDLFTDPIDAIFSDEADIGRLIHNSVKNTSPENIVAQFDSETAEKHVYSRLAMSQKAMGRYRNTPEEAAEATAWIEQEKVKFIGVLTKEPKFKTLTDEDWTKKVVTVRPKEQEAETKSKVRLLFFAEEILNKLIYWCDQVTEVYPSINVLDALCEDKDDTCEIVDAFIKYMLQHNKKYIDECHSNDLLKHLTDRKRFVAMAQVARHYKRWDDYCVRFSRRVPESFIHTQENIN